MSDRDLGHEVTTFDLPLQFLKIKCIAVSYSPSFQLSLHSNLDPDISTSSVGTAGGEDAKEKEKGMICDERRLTDSFMFNAALPDWTYVNLNKLDSTFIHFSFSLFQRVPPTTCALVT